MRDYDTGLKAKIQGCRRLQAVYPVYGDFKRYFNSGSGPADELKDLFYRSVFLAWHNNPWMLEGASGLSFRHTGLHLHYADYKGRVYTRFEAGQDPSTGPGWFIWGRHATEYADSSGTSRLIAVCGWPESPLRCFKNRNGLARSGWGSKARAQDICGILNQGYTCQPRGAVLTLDDCTTRPMRSPA